MTSSTNAPSTLLTDLPAQDDALEVEPYAYALADYLVDCPTPMTVAVQGDWGSGKTTTINLVQKRLLRSGAAEVDLVRVETWQLAQLDVGGDLVLDVLEAIVDEVARLGESATVQRIRTTLRSFRTTALTAVRAAAGLVSDTATGVVDAVVEDLATSHAERIRKLRAHFVELLAEHPRRVVVVVDDLDRLPPRHAVEIMEALKTLTECENAVFVLAIDFAVVSQGVRAKYGEDLDQRKARAYFDKMIQLPFDIPTQRFRVDGLVTSALRTLTPAVEDPDSYVALARAAVGTNPRALKRLLNSFSLLRRVAPAPAGLEGGRAAYDLGLFALLAVQAAFPVLRDDLQLRPPADAAGLLDEASRTARETGPDGDPQLDAWEVDPTRLESFADLTRTAADTLRTLPDQLTDLLRLTSITSVRRGVPAHSGTSAPAPLTDRVRATEDLGVDASLVATAAALEDAVASRATVPGITATLVPAKRMWVWYASGTGSRPTGRVLELQFMARGTINLYLGHGAWAADYRRALLERLEALSAGQPWTARAGKDDAYLRVDGITAGAPLQDLAGLVGEWFEHAQQLRG